MISLHLPDRRDSVPQHPPGQPGYFTVHTYLQLLAIEYASIVLFYISMNIYSITEIFRRIFNLTSLESLLNAHTNTNTKINYQYNTPTLPILPILPI